MSDPDGISLKDFRVWSVLQGLKHMMENPAPTIKEEDWTIFNTQLQKGLNKHQHRQQNKTHRTLQSTGQGLSSSVAWASPIDVGGRWQENVWRMRPCKWRDWDGRVSYQLNPRALSAGCISHLDWQQDVESPGQAPLIGQEEEDAVHNTFTSQTRLTCRWLTIQ